MDAKPLDPIEAIRISGVERAITVSLGIATIPNHAGDGDQLIRCADRALYLAKTNGRNRAEVAIASPSRDLLGRVPEPTRRVERREESSPEGR